MFQSVFWDSFCTMISPKTERTVLYMSHRKNILYHIGFWCVLILAVTAESWVDLLMRAL